MTTEQCINRKVYRILELLKSGALNKVHVVDVLPEPSAQIKEQLYVLLDGDTATINIVIEDDGIYKWETISGNEIINRVVVTVDSTTGNPQGTATFEDGVLTLAFTGIKGEQGNTGSSVDYPFELVNNVTEGGVDKALSAEQGKLLKQLIDTLPTRAELDNKANINGYYGGMTVGTAENLVGRGSVEAEYVNRRTSAGTADIGSGSAAITRIKGRSQVWNQLIRNGNFESTTNWSAESGSSFSVSGGVASITPAAQYKGIAQGLADIVAGHKYFVKGDVYQATDGGAYINGSLLGTNINVQLGSSNLGVWKTLSAFVTAGTGSNSSVGVGTTKSSGFAEIKAKNIIIYDLTLLGIDNLETVEEVEAWLAQNIGPLDYYAYNPGEVINNAAEGIKTRGFNLFNYATGKAYLPGKYSDYPYEYEICGTFTSISFTDVNGNTSVPELHEGRFFNVDAPGELTVVGGNNTDTLVHLVWSGWRNEGEPDYVYEPYWENTLNLGLTSLTGKLNGQGSSVVVFPHGLAKVGDVQDEIVGNRANPRVGVVDMGTLNWNYDSTNQVFYATGVTGYMKANGSCLCSKYISELPATTSANLKDKSISLNNAPIVRVKDSSFVGSTVADFKTAVTGTLLYYELATPEEYILDNPPQFNYRVDDFSTEETVPSYDPANVIAPLAYDVQYAMNAVDAIRRLPDNYVERTDVKQVTGDSQKFVLSQKAVNDNYAKKVGVEDNLTVGLAKNIEGNATSGGYPFTFVKISGTDGLAKINDVRGKSIVWNQLLLFNNKTKTINDVAFTVASGKITASGTASANGGRTDYISDGSTPLINGHKYLVINSTGLELIITSISATSVYYGLGNTSKVFTYSGTTFNNGRIGPQLTNGTQYDISGYCYLVDLTLMFGAGNEPSTVEEFEALFPLPYYAYNAGSLLNNKTERVKVVGFNQWDEEWESGIWSSVGIKTADSTNIRSKNYIPVIGGATYYFKSPYPLRVCTYDAEYNFLSSIHSGYVNIAKTLDAGVAYITICTRSGSTTTYSNDICINLSGDRNGTYEQYKTNTIELNLPTLTGKVNGEGESVVIASDGLKSAGSVYDEGIVENGYLTKIVKRIGVVDMGTLTWTLSSENNTFYSSNLADKSRGNTNIVSQKYIVIDASWTNMPDKSIKGNTTGTNIWAHDSSYETTATFKTAMSGVMLYYELAEPITYVLDTPTPATFQSYKGGTLKQIPENGSQPTTAAHAMSVTYAIDAVGILTRLPQDYLNVASLNNLLATLGGALNGTITKAWNSDQQQYTFTFTPNA